MPNIEPAMIDGVAYSLRHVGPQAAVFPAALASPVTVLACTSMVARPLPMSPLPTSPDFVSGSWTGRLGDSGEATLTFPNREASDGLPWRERFDPTGHLEFVEVYRNRELDFVGVIDQVPTVDQTQVQIHCSDGWFLLKKAYTRDWTVTRSPRDVIEHGTKVWQPLVADNFPYVGSTVPGPQWTTSSVVSTAAYATASANDASFNPIGESVTVAWDPDGIGSSGPAEFTLDGPYSGQVGSEGLQATGFGFSIPTGSTIVGIQVGILAEAGTVIAGESAEFGWIDPQIVVGGDAAGASHYPISSSGNWVENEESWVYWGGPADTWNDLTATLTPAIVNASNFGAEFQSLLGNVPSGVTGVWNVYQFWMEIFYTNSDAVAIRETGGLSLNVPAVSGDVAEITSQNVSCSSTVWMADSAVFQLPATNCEYAMNVIEDGSPVAQVEIASGVAALYRWDAAGVSYQIGQITPTSSASWDLRIECDGEWVWGFINGQLIGSFRRPTTKPGALSLVIYLVSEGNAGSAVVTSAILEAQVPFLMRSSASLQRYSPVERGGSAADGGGPNVAWGDPSYVTNSGTNTAYAYAGLSQDQDSNYLYVQDFGFSVPSDATVTGVEVRILKSSLAANAMADVGIFLVNGAVGSPGISANRAQGGYWPLNSAAGSLTTYGGLTDQWGISGGLTPALVNSANFGVAICVENVGYSGTTSALIWNPVEIVVYYTLPGGDSGDYVLPGDVSTFPWGGLHARYFNNSDLQSDPDALFKIHAPPRTTAYAGSGAAEYADQQDTTVDQQSNPQPGAVAGGSNWSCVWFGAIWLPLSKGNFTLQINAPAAAGVAMRVWVGKTQFGEQLVDEWTFTNSAFAFSFTVSASALAGTLPYGGGTVARDGWYPIKIEYAVNSTAYAAPALFITDSPAAYTDPGGTAIAAGAQATIVPSTSLSPLGCVDQRYQGIAHYDMVQQTVQAYDYQASVEPQQLESGLFPGVLAPRIREGHDTDIILTPDRSPRQDGEGILNYSSGLDATDFASSLQGNGAGLQNGTSGQLQAMVYDPPTMLASLFDAQQWQDFSDASFTQLLQASLNAQLGLQLEPWQLLSADPQGSPRLANTWPLPGELAKMRWRPGDGMRIQARDINVWDTSPRQMLTITPSILPNGKSGTQVTWAERPRTPARTLKRQLYTATRWQRNYQRQLVTLSGAFIPTNIGADTNGPYSTVLTLATDTIVRARLRISYILASFGLVVNGNYPSGSLAGPWSIFPLNLDITSIAIPDAYGQLQVALRNYSSAAADANYQLFVDVLR